MAAGINNENLIEMCKEFSQILARQGKPIWSETFHKKALEISAASSSLDMREIYKGLIDSFMGGSGSLTDFVFYKNGKLLREETNRFHFLLEKISEVAYQGLAEPEHNTD